MWRLYEVTLTLTRVQDAPPTPTPQTSDEDASGHDLRRVAARRTEAGKMGDAPQLVDLGGDVENRRRESLCEAGTWEGPDEAKTDGMGN